MMRTPCFLIKSFELRFVIFVAIVDDFLFVYEVIIIVANPLGA